MHTVRVPVPPNACAIQRKYDGMPLLPCTYVHEPLDQSVGEGYRQARRKQNCIGTAYPL